MIDREIIANDPTVQGTLPGSTADAYSLAEIEALGRKAARGAGYSWGMAEEAGKAARALAGYGLPAPDLLAALLLDNEGRSVEALFPDANHDPWRAVDGRSLCPIAAGAALSDRGHEIVAGQAIGLAQTAYPMLMVFFAGLVSHQFGRPITVAWSGVYVTCVNDELHISGAEADLAMKSTDGLRVAVGGEKETHTKRVFSPAARAVDGERWRILEDYAFRIYAPATEQSRAGAGADTDNQK